MPFVMLDAAYINKFIKFSGTIMFKFSNAGSFYTKPCRRLRGAIAPRCLASRVSDGFALPGLRAREMFNKQDG
jgi:hypothetical protein